MIEENWNKIEPSSTWDYNNEKELIGFFQFVETGVGPNKSNLYTFKKESGDLVGVWGCKVLDSRLQGIEKGTKIKIVYKGDVPTPKGKPYHDFEVFKSNIKEEPDIPIIEG